MKKILSLFVILSVINPVFVESVRGAEREHILIAGSSTVFPFSSKVAEVFGKKTSFKTPVVESIGSTSGIKSFCEGVGLNTPDIANTSRAMKSSELAKCKKNGVKGIIEVKIGYDAIVIAQSRKGDAFDLNLQHLFLALAAKVPDKHGKLVKNTYTTWKQIDSSLPDVQIKVYGPPPTSGTRDVFENIVMQQGAKAIPVLKALPKNTFKKIYTALREDGVFVESGENDNLIIQKLINNPGNVGIFGFSYMEANAGKIRGKSINGAEPTFENVLSGSYPISRPIFFYVKKQHVGIVKGIKAYIEEFTREGTWGDDGYLTDIGLVPLSKTERKKLGTEARELKPIDPS